MSITRDAEIIKYLETQGFRQLIQKPLPNPLLLRKILTNSLQIDAEVKSDEIPHQNLGNLIEAVEHVTKLIEQGKVVPIDSKKNPQIVNKMSQRLFLKEGKIYHLHHQELINEEKKIAKAKLENKTIAITLTPRPAENMRGVFAILLARDPDGAYMLEHRINNSGPAVIAGHPDLIDDQFTSVITAGEEFIYANMHRLSSNQTGHCHQHVTDIGMKIEYQAALMNFCLNEMAGCYYGIKLKENNEVDVAAYEAERIRAGANAPGITLPRLCATPRAASSATTILAGLGIDPSASVKTETVAPTTPMVTAKQTEETVLAKNVSEPERRTERHCTN